MLEFLEGDGELGFAGLLGIVDDFTFAAAFGGVETEGALEAVGESGEAGLAVGVGADLEIEFVEAAESVGDVDVDLGVVDRSAGGVSDDEVCRAGSDCAVYLGDGFWIGGTGACLRKGCETKGEGKKSEDQEIGSEIILIHVRS